MKLYIKPCELNHSFTLEPHISNVYVENSQGKCLIIIKIFIMIIIFITFATF